MLHSLLSHKGFPCSSNQVQGQSSTGYNLRLCQIPVSQGNFMSPRGFIPTDPVHDHKHMGSSQQVALLVDVLSEDAPERVNVLGKTSAKTTPCMDKFCMITQVWHLWSVPGKPDDGSKLVELHSGTNDGNFCSFSSAWQLPVDRCLQFRMTSTHGQFIRQSQEKGLHINCLEIRQSNTASRHGSIFGPIFNSGSYGHHHSGRQLLLGEQGCGNRMVSLSRGIQSVNQITSMG